MNRKEKLDSLKYRYGRKRTGEGGMSSGPGPAGRPAMVRQALLVPEEGEEWAGDGQKTAGRPFGVF